MPRTTENLTGKRFGRTVAIKPAKSRPTGGAMWLCRCDCGTKHIASSNHLRLGSTKSCGCFRREFARKQHTTHGMWGTRTRSSWGSMKSRCFNPKNDDYENYGGRGITVCKKWLKFENFLSDMGEAPKGKTLGRIDNNKGYCKANCEWQTMRQQSRNTRATRLTIEMAVSLIEKIKSGVSYRAVCKQFNIKSTGHAYLIVKGKMWPEARQIVDAKYG